MTDEYDLLTDAFERIRDTVAGTIDGLTPLQLEFRPGGQANSIAWLVWHLTRVQDDHIADAAGSEQIYTSAGWHERLALPFEADATGYAMSSSDVAKVAGLTSEQLIGYLDAVHARTVEYLGTRPDLDRVVDPDWSPPVTLAVRLVSVISDDLQHAGQAGFVRGLLPS
jgi:uncharacterized damage-inducible protein DinB